VTPVPSLQHALSLAAGLAWRAKRIPPRERLTTIHALMVLMAVEATIRWIPLPRLGRILGVRFDLTPTACPAVPVAIDSLPAKAQRALRSTKRITRWSPFWSGPCLRRSLVAAHLIRDLNPAVRIGISGEASGLRAHAWIEIDHAPLEDIGQFTSFQWPSATDSVSAAS